MEILHKLFPFLGQVKSPADKKAPKVYPFSSTRQHTRAICQGLHNVRVNVAGKHNTVLQTGDAK
jgi:hypothetical protein